MSKQTEAKAKQNYTPKSIPDTCSNCAQFKSDVTMERSRWGGPPTKKDRNMRCGIGGFKVMKLGKCDLHEPKP